jgi:hypothetical protein
MARRRRPLPFPIREAVVIHNVRPESVILPGHQGRSRYTVMVRFEGEASVDQFPGKSNKAEFMLDQSDKIVEVHATKPESMWPEITVVDLDDPHNERNTTYTIWPPRHFGEMSEVKEDERVHE